MEHLKYIVFNGDVYSVNIEKPDERAEVSLLDKDNHCIGLIQMAKYDTEHFIENELHRVIADSDYFEETLPDNEDFEYEEAEEISPNKPLSHDERTRLDEVKCLIEDKDIAYCVEWLKSNNRNVGFGRLLLDIAHFIAIEDEKEYGNNSFVYLNSCSFGRMDNTKLNNISLDAFYEKAGFESFLRYPSNGATMMFLPELENFVSKNEIVFYDNFQLANSALEQSIIDSVKVKNSKKRNDHENILTSKSLSNTPS